MDDLGVIDRFLNVYAQYIDSGFELLGGEVAFLASVLIVIDVTLAGLFWAMGGNDDVIARLIKKILYVGAFAFIIGNFNALAEIVFRSFAGLGLLASGASIGEAELLRPGRLAEVGVEAGRPMLDQIQEMAGFPQVFVNLDSITVLFLAWLVVILSFFVLAVQLFVTLIEFKLTTLAGFVLVPFALWNKTAFLAEKVLGNVMSSGVKVLVLAVIVGIGTGLFDEFTLPPGTEPSIDHALAIMLGSLTLFGLGLFGPGIATGLVSGGPQLGAGAAAGVALAAAGVTTATGAAAVGAARIAGSALGAGTRGRAPQASHAPAAAMAGGKPSGPSGGPSGGAPRWAQRMQQSRQRTTRGLATAAMVVRSSDRGGGGAGPKLGDD
ncbi:P-type conjugative transfer protein TrbL [Pseudoxanthomonas putridarboris]|uniref:P-type conjugative transfer protein TrbL n=1 Tax=Pseudoxanthomonas putridarboris TaxID=752605 RepID=A0ABU9IV71_9GAMM